MSSLNNDESIHNKEQGSEMAKSIRRALYVEWFLLNWFWVPHIFLLTLARFDLSGYLLLMTMYLGFTPVGIVWQGLGLFLSKSKYANHKTKLTLAAFVLNGLITLVYIVFWFWGLNELFNDAAFV